MGPDDLALFVIWLRDKKYVQITVEDDNGSAQDLSEEELTSLAHEWDEMAHGED